MLPLIIAGGMWASRKTFPNACALEGFKITSQTYPRASVKAQTGVEQHLSVANLLRLKQFVIQHGVAQCTGFLLVPSPASAMR